MNRASRSSDYGLEQDAWMIVMKVTVKLSRQAERVCVSSMVLGKMMKRGVKLYSRG